MPSTVGSPVSEKYLAKHRRVPMAPRPVRLRSRLRGRLLGAGVAVVSTGLAVSAGVLVTPSPVDGAAAALSSSSPERKLSAAELAEREERSSRSAGDRRTEADRGKAQRLSNATGVAVTRSQDLRTADPKALARALMPKAGLSASEFDCVDNLWVSESGWDVHADNPTSSAYGIPQALPGSKMSSAGPDWEDNPETQIRWGLGYIKDRYGSACEAWSFKQGAGWY